MIDTSSFVPHLSILWRWRSRLRRRFPLLGHGGSGLKLPGYQATSWIFKCLAQATAK